MSTRRKAAQLLKELIKIDSQNPPGRERKVILFIQSYLKRLGVPTEVFEFKKDRLNLVGIVKSKRSEKKLLLAPHVDTVPATGKWRFSPFSGKLYRGKIYGRGATDCKVNVAAALLLIKELKEERIILDNLDLVFAFCGDEEAGSKSGIIPLLKFLKKINYGIVLDADEFNIVVAQKGLLHLRVEIFGKEAHGAYPGRGVNAIEKSVNILKEITRSGIVRRTHPLLGKPTISTGRIGGGDKVNIVAGFAFFELDIRYLPKMRKEKIIEEIGRIIKRRKVKYKLKILAAQEPIEINRKSSAVKTLREVLKRNLIRPDFVPSFGATVINFLKDKGVESFAFGFGTKGEAHTRDECVALGNLYLGVKVLKDYVRELDGHLNRALRRR